MNTVQLTTNTQNTPQADSSQTDLIPTKEDFEQQLFVAQKDTDWFTETDAQTKKEKIQKELSEKKRRDEIHENEKSAELLTMAVLAKTQLSESTETVRLSDDFDQASIQQKILSKQEVFNKAVQEKVSAQKAHLVTPAVQSDESADEAAMRFSEALTKGSEETAQKQPTDAKASSAKPEATTSNTARLAALSQIAEMAQRSNLPNGNQNAVNAQEFRLDRQSIRNLSEGQFSNLGQKNQSETGSKARSVAKTSSARGSSVSSSSLSPSIGLNKSELSSQARSAESKETQNVNIKEVVGKVKLMISTKTNEIVMHLAPEHLGKLEIKLKKEGDKLSGRFKVENAEAKRALETQLSQLQKGLEEQGIHVEEFTILVDDQGSAESTFAFNEGHKQEQNSQEPSSGNSVLADTIGFSNESATSTTRGADSGVSLYI